jgi:branched-chain amino acid transport system permease protein
MSVLLQQLVNGLAIGSLYGCVAVGLTLIFFVTRMVQVAHGEIVMIGAYVGWWTLGQTNNNVLLALVAAAIFTFGAGALIERVLLRPFQGREDDYPVIVITIALGLGLMELVRLRVRNGQPVEYPFGGLLTKSIEIGAVRMAWASVAAFVLLIVFTLGTTLVLERSRHGLAMRAMSANHENARLLGVRVGPVAALTIGAASSVAAIAGVLAGFRVGAIAPNIGALLGLKALAVALFVGLGNVRGAAVGALLLGVAESLVIGYTSGSYQDALAFGLIIVILLVRPQGLFGAPSELAIRD